MDKDKYSTGATRHSDNNGERFDLISPQALRRLSVICAEGAKSHGERNWEKGLPKESTIKHLLWHLNRYQSDATDQDHLAKVMWGVMVLLHFEENICVTESSPTTIEIELLEAPRPHHGALDDSKDGKRLKYGGYRA